jgi:hypothetical protein
MELRGKMSHCYIWMMKLPGIIEDYLENEMKSLKVFSKDVYMNVSLEKCAKLWLIKCRVDRKTCIGNTFDSDIKEMNPREA